MSVIAVVVPTIRYENEYRKFLRAWSPRFHQYEVDLVTVIDGEVPEVRHVVYSHDNRTKQEEKLSIEDVMGSDVDLIPNKTDGCRNLGFAYVARFLPDVDYILTLDDDVAPFGDTIGSHLNALEMRVPVSWINTFLPGYMPLFPRGFPYGIRDEAEVVMSHGIWYGVKDWDAPTQLQLKDPAMPMNFYVGPIPKGIYFAVCGMNLAFKRKALKWAYFAPMSMKTWGMDRFADIWMGVTAKREIDKAGYALVTGYSVVKHLRASNPMANLVKEAVGLGLNESYWKGEEDHGYFRYYNQMRQRWQEWIEQWEVSGENVSATPQN